MKKILISIKPKYVAEILNHRKTLEIRKSFPKCKLPCEVYIYCTKDQKLGLHWAKKWVCVENTNKTLKECSYNGLVVARFTLDKVHEINKDLVGDEEYEGYKERCYESREIKEDELLKLSCLDYLDLRFYLDPHDYPKRGKVGYAWHIDNLVIFDKPKELKDFFVRDKKGDIPVQVEELKGSKFMAFKRIEHAPQSYCFCEVEE